MGIERITSPVAAPGQRSTPFAVIARPFGTRIESVMPWGLTIAQMLEQSAIDPAMLRRADIYLVDPESGRQSLVFPQFWSQVRPRFGCEVVIRIWPGKHGGGGKSILGIVLGIAILAVSAFAGPALAVGVLGAGASGVGLLGGAISGVIGIVGKMLISALIPPPKPAKLSGSLGGSSRADSPSYSISGTQNQLDPYGVVPRIYGRFRYSPKYAAKPFTEIVGSDQYLRILFDFGYGPLQLEDHRIGEAPLDQFNEVETNIHPAWDPSDPADALTIYTNDIDETALSIEIANDGVRTAAAGATGALTFSGNVSGMSQTVTIGSQTYTFVASISTTPNRVKIGATAADSIKNLTAAINRAAGAGTLYSATTSENADVKAAATSATVLTVTAKTAGTAGNAIVTTEAVTAATWGGGTLSGGTDNVTIDVLTEDEKWFSSTTGLGADQFSGDISFVNGLYRIDNGGSKNPITVRFDIRYRVLSSGDDWTYVSTAASNVLDFTGQPGDGQTVTIGSRTYTFQTTLTNVAGNVQIGVNLATSISNLALAINRHGGAGTAYAAATTEHPDVDGRATSIALVITARHIGNRTGPDGNGITSSETLAHADWRKASTTGGADVLKVTGQDSTVRVGFGPVRPPAQGQFEVQVRRLDVNSTDAAIQDRSFWTALRTITLIAPVRVAGRCLVEMRIKATDQLNGVVNTYNAIATSLLPTWNGAAWTDPVATRNPAWIYVDILRGSANGAALADNRLDLTSLKDWADACDADDADGDPLYSCDGVFDFKTTVYQALSDVASTGRATPDVRDGLFSIVRDIAQTVPVQHITPRNSWGAKGTIVFPDTPDALRIPFKNEEIGWQDDERTVYADGFDQISANKFEVLAMPLVTRPKQIWRDGRYLQAAAKLRPATYQVNMDPEWMQCRRGDLVLFAHDVIRVGIAWGRIKSLALDGDGNTVAVTLDEEITMEAGKTYALSVRRGSDDATLTLSLLTVPGSAHTLELPTQLAPAASPEEGDLASFGEAARVQLACLVKSIEPDTGQNALLTLIDASPAVHDADQGEIPPYEPQTTSLVPIQNRRPPVPVIGALKSDETVLSVNPDGSYVAAIQVPFGGLSGGDAVAAYVESWFKASGSDAAWQRGSIVPAALGSLTVPGVDSGTVYDLRFRSVTIAGVASDWTTVLNYFVVGDTSAPPAPINPQLTALRVVTWQYPSPPRDFPGGGFRIKAIAAGAPLWSAGFFLSETPVAQTSFDVSGLDNGQWTIMVKAVDRSGNESVETMFLVIDLGPVQAENAIDPVDLAAADFPGTIVNGSVSSHILTADIEVTAMWPSDPMAPMWSSDVADAMWGSQAQEMTYTATVTPPAADIGSTVKLDLVTAGAPVTVTYSKDGGSTWLSWPGAIISEDIAYQFRFVSQGGAAPGVISGLTVIFDVADESEVVLDFAIAATTGTRLTLTKAYRRIDIVRPELVFHSGETPVSIEVQDYGTVVSDLVTAGPLIKTMDASRAAVAGHIRAHLLGPKAAA